MSSVAVPDLPSTALPRSAADLRRQLEASLAERIPAAFTVYDRSLPEMAPSGIAALDELTGGLPRGALSEVAGPASSGRTSLLLATLAAATARGEACALVDVSDAFDPESGAAAGIDLSRLLWVRCRKNPPQRHGDTEKNKQVSRGLTRIHTDQIGNQKSKLKNSSVSLCLGGGSSSSDLTRRPAYARLDQALRAADLMISGGGFGVIAIDMGDVPVEAAQRVPLASWFRFRRAVENTPAVLLLVAQRPVTQSCAAFVLQLQPSALSTQHSDEQQLAISNWQLARHGLTRVETPHVAPGAGPWPLTTDHSCPTHAELLTALPIRAEVVRSPLRRRPARAAHAEFQAQAPWAS